MSWLLLLLLLLMLLLLLLLLLRMWRPPLRGIADGDEETVAQAVEDDGGTEEG
jgi:F0F1-type ATP synthase membrane subunit b/b'